MAQEIEGSNPFAHPIFHASPFASGAAGGRFSERNPVPDENPTPEAEELAPDSAESAGVPTEAMTPSGYTYEVVGEDAPATKDIQSRTAEKGRVGLPMWALVPAVILPAIAVGVAVWFLFSGSSGGDDQLNANTTSLLNAFTSGNGETNTIRYEGQVPPGYPEGIPSYSSANVTASVLQLSGEDAGYIVVGDTSDGRDVVAAAMKEKFGEDPWQIDGVQDGRDSTLYQFSRIDDANISGIVLLAASKDGSRTTIITSIQEVAGAADREPDKFESVASRSAPDAFPKEIPVYEGAVLLESAYQNDAGAKSFRVSYITKDDADDILKFYRDGLEGNKLTVEDGDATASTLEGAKSIRFSDDDLKLNGVVTIGTFSEDHNYTRIDVQAGDER